MINYIQSEFDLEQREERNGILLGLFLSADMMIKIINILFPIENMLVIYYLILIGLIFCNNKKILNIKYIFLYIAISVLFGFSYLRIIDGYYTIQYFVYFSCFYFCSSVIQFPMKYQNTFKIINRVNVLFTLYLLFIVIPQYNAGTLDINSTMNLSYSALIGIASFILTLKLPSYTQSKIFITINLFCVLTELFFMVFISYNRGALLGLFAIGYFFILNNLIKKYNKYIFSIISLSVGYFALINIEEIFLHLAKILSNQGVTTNFLDKSIASLTMGNFDSRRKLLYEKAISLFYESPLLGKGIGYFPSVARGQYPHNLFIESLAETGILFTIPLVIFIIYCLYYFMNSENKVDLHFTVMLFILSVPQLLVSSTFWMSPFFWTLVVFMLVKPTSKKEQLTL